MGNVMAQDIITNPLLFVFKLHGQTRKYQFTFNQSNDTLYLHWGIERNTRWQSGSYAMPQEALKTAVRLSFLQPEDGQHICLPIQETFALLSATAFQELKSQKAFHYNQTEYQLADTKSQAMGYSLLHVNDSVDGCEMWIMDNPDFPLIWEIQNNPLGINWKVAPIDLPAHNLKEEIIQSPEKWVASIMLIPHQTAYKLRYPKVTVLLHQPLRTPWVPLDDFGRTLSRSHSCL